MWQKVLEQRLDTDHPLALDMGKHVLFHLAEVLLKVLSLLCIRADLVVDEDAGLLECAVGALTLEPCDGHS